MLEILADEKNCFSKFYETPYLTLLISQFRSISENHEIKKTAKISRVTRNVTHRYYND